MRFKFTKLLAGAALMLATQLSAEMSGFCCDNQYISGGYVQYENVIVRPYFSRNNAYFLEDAEGFQGQIAKQFQWSYEYTPRVEIGIQGHCDIGLRGRYWNFNHSENIHATDTNGDIATYFADDSVSDDIGFDGSSEARFSHGMKLHVGDVEATFNKCDWIFAIGGRFVSTRQTYTAENISSTGYIDSKQSFNGAGITAAVDYFHPVWCDLSLYAKARGSLLFGSSKWTTYNLEETTRIHSSNKRDLVPVGELQLGLDYRKTFCDCINAYMRFGFEAQYWGSLGVASPNCNAIWDEGNYQDGHPLDADVGFIGFNIALGVTF